MRTRDEIHKVALRHAMLNVGFDDLTLEVLLDIRDQNEVVKEALQTLVVTESNKLP